MNYIVVYETMSGPNEGERTWSIHSSEEAFTKWYAGAMRDGTDEPIAHVYKIVANGITPKDAIRICDARRELYTLEV
ncbi:MAG: hypothetical protein HY365_01370 [Candidatus Aenigmarchaeota archaeon]|nr:hypothetical protein [Candidatus Aenigmarchaeota archaeon]